MYKLKSEKQIIRSSHKTNTMKTILLFFSILCSFQFAKSQTAEPFVLENPAMNSIAKFGACNGKIIYSAISNTTLKRSLWVSDGTVGGTTLLKEDLAIDNLIEYNGKTFLADPLIKEPKLYGQPMELLLAPNW